MFLLPPSVLISLFMQKIIASIKKLYLQIESSLYLVFKFDVVILMTCWPYFWAEIGVVGKKYICLQILTNFRTLGRGTNIQFYEPFTYPQMSKTSNSKLPQKKRFQRIYQPSSGNRKTLKKAPFTVCTSNIFAKLRTSTNYVKYVYKPPLRFIGRIFERNIRTW